MRIRTAEEIAFWGLLAAVLYVGAAFVMAETPTKENLMRKAARKAQWDAGHRPDPGKTLVCPEGFEPDMEIEDGVCTRESRVGVACEEIYGEGPRLLLHVTLNVQDQDEPYTLAVVELSDLRGIISDGEEWIGACEAWKPPEQEN